MVLEARGCATACNGVNARHKCDKQLLSEDWWPFNSSGLLSLPDRMERSWSGGDGTKCLVGPPALVETRGQSS
jgi:hypothetical protein